MMSDVEEVFRSGKHLPFLPKVAHEILQALHEDTPNLKQVANKINHDPVIAAKVLKLANSAKYGVQRKVKTIEEASALIGFGEIAILVVVFAVTNTIVNVPNIDLRRFWIHSLLTASISRALAIEMNKMRGDAFYSPELSYLCGLMHSIGLLILHLFFPHVGARIEQACKASSVLARIPIEKEGLGVDHCQVGQELAKRWGLPIEIQQTIRYYAEPNHPQAGYYAPIVHQAVLISHGIIKQHPTDEIKNALYKSATMLFTSDKVTLQTKIDSYAAFLPEAESLI